MLKITGEGKTSTCNGATRRDFLQVGTLGALGFGLPQWFAAQAAGAVKPGSGDKSCIMIFNLGAPSNMDLWDMKPDAPAEIRGPFKPIATKSTAIQFSEILPRHAQIADKISLVRSVCHGGAAVHDAGWQMMQTGRLFAGGVNTPHVGSVVSYLEGRKGDLPPFVVLPELMGRGGGNMPNGQAGGFWARRTTRSRSTPTPPSPISGSPTCSRPGRSAASGSIGGGRSARSSMTPSPPSSRPRTPRSWTAIFSRPSG